MSTRIATIAALLLLLPGLANAWSFYRRSPVRIVQLEAGEPCFADTQCATGACVPSGEGQAVCAEPGGGGVACSASEDCKSGHCIETAEGEDVCSEYCSGAEDCAFLGDSGACRVVRSSSGRGVSLCVDPGGDPEADPGFGLGDCWAEGSCGTWSLCYDQDHCDAGNHCYDLGLQLGTVGRVGVCVSYCEDDCSNGWECTRAGGGDPYYICMPPAGSGF